MKTIKELKKTVSVLKRTELKSLLGGFNCGHLDEFTCTITDESGSFSGIVCAKSASHAQTMVRSSVNGNGDIENSMVCG